MARLKNEYGSVCASESTVDAAETEAPPRGPEARAETSLRDDRSSAQLSSCVARVGVGGRAPRRRARGVDGAVATTARDAMRDARACAVDIDESTKRPSMRPSRRVGRGDVEDGPAWLARPLATRLVFRESAPIFYSRRRRSPRAR